MTSSRQISLVFASLFLATTMTILPAAAQQQQQRRPNILVIMGDDVGWFNIGAYHQGIMSGKTPNLDRLASEGMRFTDYYAEASCTAGRANFITGELPIRTGLTTVGQAGADVGLPAQAVTLATALKAQGYATGQFGKNHLGDLNKFLPTLHGFDEFFGYLYHLDAMSDPYWYSFPVDETFYNTFFEIDGPNESWGGARVKFGGDTTGGGTVGGMHSPFYVWASVIQDGRVVATDYALKRPPSAPHRLRCCVHALR